MGHEVFISYSSIDKAYAVAICHKLESMAIGCWIAPRDINPSDDWAEAIINAMENAKILLLVFSASSNNSPQVRREVERAVNKGLIVLPFRIENVPLSKSLEYFISAQHWLDAIAGDMEEHLAKLSDCVASLLGRQIAPSTMPNAPTEAVPIPPHVMAQQIPAEILSKVEVFLAQVLGPIAKHLVKSRATANMTAKELVAVLSQEIDDERERKQFVQRCSALV